MLTTRMLPALVQVVASLVELVLGLRIVLKLFDANPSTPFVNWVYQTTQPLLTPFEGMFPSPTLTGGFVIEFSTVFALMAYAFIGYLLVEIIDLLEVNTTRRTVSKK